MQSKEGGLVVLFYTTILENVSLVIANNGLNHLQNSGVGLLFFLGANNIRYSKQEDISSVSNIR